MNSAIEFHDSRLEGAVLRKDDAIEVLFSRAYIHRSQGLPGTDDGVGGWQSCSMIVGDARLYGELGKLPAWVLTGEVTIGSESATNVLDLPCHVIGQPVQLELYLADDYRRVVISGKGMEVVMHGQPEFTEKYEPSKWRR